MPTSPELHPPGATRRLRALDAFRGLTVAGMLLVNNPGTWSAIYPPLQHAPWHGWTLTDLIFPFFLFIVGVTTHISLTARRARGDSDAALAHQVLRRGLLIILFGLLLASFPWFPLERITAVRFPGVLQRIGAAYMVGAFITLRAPWRVQVGAVAGILFGYWALITLIPVPGIGTGPQLLDDPSSSLAAWIDRQVFGTHLWRSSRTWDPEGLLSTLPAVGTVLLGALTGRWLASARPLAERLAAMFALGAILMVAGLVWHWGFPINKNLWSSSYVLFTGGMAATAVATCTWLIDVLGITSWSVPFVWFGTNPMIAFLGSGAMARLMGSVITVPSGSEEIPLQRVIHDRLFASWMEPRSASLLYAMAFVLVWAGILGLLHRRRLFLKV